MKKLMTVLVVLILTTTMLPVSAGEQGVIKNATSDYNQNLVERMQAYFESSYTGECKVDNKDICGPEGGGTYIDADNPKLSYVTNMSIEHEGEKIQSGSELVIGNIYSFNVGIDLPEWFMKDKNIAVNKGDYQYVSFDLPEGINFKGPTHKIEVKENDQVIAEIEFTQGVESKFEFKITYLDIPEGVENITLNFNFDTLLNVSDDLGVGEIEIELPFLESGSVTLNNKSNLKPEEGVLKVGESNPEDISQVLWQIDVNRDGLKHTNLSLVDTLDESQWIKEIKVYEAKYKKDGTRITPDPSAQVIVINPKDKTNEYTLNFAELFGKDSSKEDDSSYYVEIVSEFDYDAYRPNSGEDSKHKELTNNAVQKSDQNSIQASDSVKVTYEDRIVKTAEDKYVKDGQTYIKWQVDFNKGKENLEDVVLTDILPEHTELVESSLEIEKSDGTKLQVGVDYVLEESKETDNSFTIRFSNSVNEHLKITYDSVVDDKFEIVDSHEFSNSIKHDTFESTGKITIGQSKIKKSITSINRKDKIAKVTLDINNDEKELKNLVISDTFNTAGLTVIEKTIKITHGNEDITSDKWKYEADSSAYGGFRIVFNDDLVFNKKITVTFDTEYDIHELDNSNKESFNGNFKNTAKMAYVNTYGVAVEAISPAEFDILTEEKYDGRKEGTYDATDKTITWDIYTNYNNKELVNAVLTDQLPTGLKIDEATIKYYLYNVDEDGKIHIKEPVCDIEKYIISTDVSQYKLGDETGQTITVELKDSAEAEEKHPQIGISFKTQVIDNIIKKSYLNSATFVNQGFTTKLQKTVDVKYGEEIVNKTGLAVKEDGYDTGVLDWTVYINRSQSSVANVIVEDFFTPNHKLMKSSVKVHPLIVDKDGNLTPDPNDAASLENGTDYDLVLNNDDPEQPTFKITFKGSYQSIDRAYVLTYSSYVNFAAGETNFIIKNDISVSGNTTDTEKIEAEGGMDFNFSSGSGSGNTRLAHVGIIKQDQFGEPVEGAKFSFTNKLYPDIEFEGTTDESGQLIFSNIAKGQYTVVELEAPSGYQKYEGSIVVDSGVNGDLDFDVFLNYKNAIQVVKESSTPGVDPAGAIFGIYKNKDDVSPLYTSVTDHKGIAKFDRLVDDNRQDVTLIVGETYYIKELKALDNHILSTKVHEVVIEPVDLKTFVIGESFDQDLIDQMKQPYSGTINVVNHQGTANITKVDVNENPISGVVFEVYEVDSDVLVNQVTTDAQGRATIDGLAPGHYVVKEVEANGYIIQEGVIRTIYIPENDLDSTLFDENKVPLEIELETVVNYKGSVRFLKTDKLENPLAGAEFALMDDKFEVIDTIITGTDGVVYFNELAPGSYYLQEIKAPDGYVMDETLIPFVIDKFTVDGMHDITDIDNHVNYQGSLLFNKIDGDTFEGIKGAEFTLYSADDHIEVSSVYSNEQGKVLFNNIRPGSYYVKETKAASNYILNTDFYYEFTVEAIFNQEQKFVVSDVLNYQGTVEVLKTDADGKPLAGTSFMIMHEDGTIFLGETGQDGILVIGGLKPGSYTISEVSATAGYIRETKIETFKIDVENQGKPNHIKSVWVNYLGSAELLKTNTEGEALSGVEFTLVGPGHEDGTLFTTVDGKILFENLAVGEYTLTETKASPGYIMNTEPITFEVLESSFGKPEVIQLHAVNKMGSVELIKTDVDGKALEGVVFELFANDKSIGEYTTDVNGKLSIEALPVGSYILRETKAQDGYILNTQAIHFDIKDRVDGSAKPVFIEYTNYKGSIVLNKVNPQGKLIGGAEFELYDENQQLVQSIVSESGLTVIHDLAPGAYTLVETKAPKGYIKSNVKTHFEIEAEYSGEYSPQTIEVVNEKAPVLPSTGVTNYMTLYIFMSFVGFAFIITSKFKRSKVND